MKAHAPGSVTGLFAPPSGDLDAGARGASFAIEDGVVVSVEPARETVVSVDGEPAPFEPVERVLSRLGVDAAVRVTLEVPLGHGFGASGAATLATALAANAGFDLGRPRDDLVEAAHLAEVAAGTGLGDVFVQDRGGLLWSGAEGRNRTEPDAAVEYTTFGGIDTAGVVGDEAAMDRIRIAGTELFDRLPPRPAIADVADLSWEFARRTGLATDRVADEIARVREAGGAAGMAMLGETVFAAGIEGALDRRTRVSNRGATLR